MYFTSYVCAGKNAMTYYNVEKNAEISDQEVVFERIHTDNTIQRLENDAGHW